MRLRAAIGAAVIALAAFLVWQRARHADVAAALASAREALTRDQAEPLERAQAELSRLAHARRGGARVDAWLQALGAVRWFRFGAAEDARSQAGDACVGTPRTDTAAPCALAATLLALRQPSGNDPLAAARPALARAGSDPAARLALGLAAAQALDLPAAEESLSLAVAEDRAWRWPAVELARVQRRRGRLEAARAITAELLARDPGYVPAEIERAADDTLAGNPPDEVALSELANAARATGIANTEAELSAVRARIALGRGQPDVARAALEQALSVAPYDVEYGLALGRAELQPGGDAARALAHLVPVASAPTSAAAEPEFSAAVLARADALIRLGRAAEAQAALATQPGDRARVLLLAAALDAGPLAQAVADCRGLAGRPGTLSDLEQELALPCAEALAERGDGATALRLCDRVSRPDLRSLAEGLRRLFLGSPADAIDLLAGDRAVRARAVALTEIGHLEAAEQTLVQAERKSAGAWRERAALAALRAARGDTASARKLIATAVADHPSAPAAIAALAEVLIRAGDRTQAQTLLTQVAVANPDAPTLLLARAHLALAEGDAAATGRALERARALDPAAPALAGLEVAAALQSDDLAALRTAVERALGTSAEAAFAAARALAEGGQVGSAIALTERAALTLSGPAAASRRTLALLAVGRAGLRSPEASGHAAARALLARLAGAHNAPAYAVYLSAREVEKERGIDKALPLYREAIERDPALADALLRVGRRWLADPRTRDDGVATLRRYLRLADAGDGATWARNQLARLGR
jgi:hypothetical protein